MVKEIEVNGLQLTIDMAAMTDIEVYDMLYQVNNGNPGPILCLLKSIVKKGLDELLESLRGENGRISVFDAAPAITAIFQAANLGE